MSGAASHGAGKIWLCLPTKSLSLTASMLFRLMEAKSSSARKGMDTGGHTGPDRSLNAPGCPSAGDFLYSLPSTPLLKCCNTSKITSGQCADASQSPRYQYSCSIPGRHLPLHSSSLSIPRGFPARAPLPGKKETEIMQYTFHIHPKLSSGKQGRHL